MNSTDLFDLLLTDRKITIETSNKDANTIRVAIIRKFTDYKKQMAKLGFLDADLENCSVSLEYDEASNVARYFLRPRKRSAVTFTIVMDEQDQDQENTNG